MFIVAPDFHSPGFGVARIAWELDSPAQANLSRWTGRRTVVADPWHRKWSAKVALCPVVGDSNIRAMRSFLARCKGSIATFRLYATEGPQNANVDVTVMDAQGAAGSTAFTLTGLSSAMLEGQMITVSGQLLALTRVGYPVGADQAVYFEPPLRQSAPAGTPVVTARPYALAHMAEATAGWSVEPGAVYGISFDVEEAILEADGTAPESQLVANGDFTTDTAGWTPASAALSVVGARLRVANTTTAAGYAWQAVNLTVGMTYRLTADLFGLTGPALLRIGAVVGGADGGGFASVGRNTTGAADISFVATAATMYISPRVNSTVANEYAEFDNISLRVA